MSKTPISVPWGKGSMVFELRGERKWVSKRDETPSEFLARIVKDICKKNSKVWTDAVPRRSRLFRQRLREMRKVQVDPDTRPHTRTRGGKERGDRLGGPESLRQGDSGTEMGTEDSEGVGDGKRGNHVEMR